MAYVGTPIDTTNQFQSLAGKRFDGDGSTTAFTLDVAPSSTLDIEVFVGNVRQDPNSAYTLSGTTLTFTGAPPSGTNNIYVVHQAKSVGTISVPDSYKSDSQTISGARTFNGGITMGGTTPTLTIGDAGAEDAKIVFDGNAQDYHIGLDDSADDLVIGKGSALGTTAHIVTDENGHVTMPLQSFVYAYMDGDQTMTANDNDEKVELDAELYDVNGDFNVSDNTFTAPVTGIYMVTATWAITGDLNSNITDMFFKLGASNGDEIIAANNPQAIQVSTASGFMCMINGSIQLQMDANDTLIMEADCFSGAGASHQYTLNGGTNPRGDTTRMVIYLLG